MRVTRDQRGYETTVLLHTPRLGDRPRVLYWYRTAPGVRVGRPALDEEAIRTIEEQHPDIEFDWPQLLEEAASAAPEVERRPERRRKPSKLREEELPAEPVVVPHADEPGATDAKEAKAAEVVKAEAPAVRNTLLDQLVGREIATRLRARYADIAARIAQVTDETARAAWQARVDALDPDRWITPDAILHGVENADRLFDELRRELA